MKLTANDLSSDQHEAYTQIMNWLRSRNGQILTLGGYAGTGKSTVTSVVAAALKSRCVAYCTLTGKASSVLGKKLREAGVAVTNRLRRRDVDDGISDEYFDDSLTARGGAAYCGTMHRLIYLPVIDPITEEVRGYAKRDELDRRYDLIVLDEASMVSDETLEDLKMYGIPILAVGDHGQLPPVYGTSSLMAEPDLRLEKIHRQAEGNPIIALSKAIRETGIFPLKPADDEAITYGHKSRIDDYLKIHYGDVPSTALFERGLLCYTNKSRVWLNQQVRRARRISGVPIAGEQVICLRNRPPIYNGMRGMLTSNGQLDEKQPWILNAEVKFPEEGLEAQWLAMCAPQFNREATYNNVEELHKRGIDVMMMSSAGMFFDFGYALTVHKSQGAQWDQVIVYIDRPLRPYAEDFRRWAYTAVTRAARKLTVLR